MPVRFLWPGAGTQEGANRSKGLSLGVEDDEERMRDCVRGAKRGRCTGAYSCASRTRRSAAGLGRRPMQFAIKRRKTDQGMWP
jgi:hypothetical protein